MIIVIVILNQISLVLVDVLKENIQPMFKHIIRTSIRMFGKFTRLSNASESKLELKTILTEYIIQ